MKTSYKILTIITIIIAIIFSSISVIDYVYGHSRDFKPVFGLACPLIPIPDDFEANQIFFAVYYTDPVKQLDMIWYHILNTCVTQSEKFQVQEILNDCHNDKLGFKKSHFRLEYHNSTHYIDNNYCQWQKITKFPSTDNDCIPGPKKWVSEEEFRNATHLYNIYRCLWEEKFSGEKEWTVGLEYDDTIYTKGCPQFCPKEKSNVEELENEN